MSVQYFGSYGVRHVQQPEGSELCFAAIVSSVTHAKIDAAQSALLSAKISEQDGSTGAITQDSSLEIDGNELLIKAVANPITGPDETPAILEAIYSQLDQTNPVAVLHKKRDDPEDERHHWSLIVGRLGNRENTKAVAIMDPLKTYMVHPDVEEFAEMIDRSVNFMGVYAVALSFSRSTDS